MSTIKKGSTVRQVVPVIEGQVLEKKFNDDTDKFEFRVEYTLPDGGHCERWFSEDDIEEIAAPAEKPEGEE
ncbi:MAG: hypothetical protein V4447_10785 [Pseudomonadota bacterium]